MSASAQRAWQQNHGASHATKVHSHQPEPHERRRWYVQSALRVVTHYTHTRTHTHNLREREREREERERGEKCVCVCVCVSFFHFKVFVADDTNHTQHTCTAREYHSHELLHDGHGKMGRCNRCQLALRLCRRYVVCRFLRALWRMLVSTQTRKKERMQRLAHDTTAFTHSYTHET